MLSIKTHYKNYFFQNQSSTISLGRTKYLFIFIFSMLKQGLKNCFYFLIGAYGKPMDRSRRPLKRLPGLGGGLSAELKNIKPSGSLNCNLPAN